jgi:hypothetical protein
MKTQSEDYLIREIVSNIPKKCKPVSFIAGVLKISKSSAYRRLEGKQPFQLDEIFKLSSLMNFSLDEVNRRQRQVADSSRKTDAEMSQNPALNIMNTIEKFVDIYCRFETKKAIFSANRISLPFLLEYDNLFLFFINSVRYKWLKAGDNFTSFALVLPEEFRRIREEINERRFHLESCEYILDMDHLFESIVREIQYFRRLKLITEEFCLLLKQELLALLERMEHEMTTGRNRRGCECKYYLSWLGVESNLIFAKCGDNQLALCLNHGASLVRKENICPNQAEYADLQKKYAVLVTQSNDVIRSEFIERQREIIERINDGRFVY